FSSNPYGDGYVSFPDTEGTGEWKEYLCMVKCGQTGTFSSTNYFALIGEFGVTWYLASETVYDMSDAEIDWQKLIDNETADRLALTASLKAMAYEDVVELSKLGTTVIEGGKIKTTLLDADYIRANIVNADYINSLEIVANTINAN